MKNFISIWVLFFCLQHLSCQQGVPINDLDNQPVITEKDEKYANVYKILDGRWKGRFKIYEDQKRTKKNKVDFDNLLINFQKKGLKLVGDIEVEQVYTSESPYFQKVKITDFYPESGKKEVAHGVNKIQNGTMWCVVRKPNDTVIHEGTLDGKNTIIWQRSEQNPQRVEYFRETVDEQSYVIIGWGYYEGDDLDLSPKFWFYGKYERQ